MSLSHLSFSVQYPLIYFDFLVEYMLIFSLLFNKILTYVRSVFDTLGH